MSADMILHSSLPVPTNITDIQAYAQIFAKSGYFSDSREMAQAAVKIIAGAECGIRPFASMNGIYIVKGRTSMSANLMATLVKQSRRYNYRIVELTTERAEIAYFECNEEIGRSEFTRQDAIKAGTQNMDKFARNMLFARAMSNGVRWYCPDVTGGPVYTPEELGEAVNEDGEPIRPISAVNTQTGEVIETQAKAIEAKPAEEEQPAEERDLLAEFTARCDSLGYDASQPRSRKLLLCSLLDLPLKAKTEWAHYEECLDYPDSVWTKTIDDVHAKLREAANSAPAPTPEMPDDSVPPLMLVETSRPESTVPGAFA